MTDAYVIDGFRIPVVTVPPSRDLRWALQADLLVIDTPEARAELARRAAIVAARNGGQS